MSVLILTRTEPWEGPEIVGTWPDTPQGLQDAKAAVTRGDYYWGVWRLTPGQRGEGEHVWSPPVNIESPSGLTFMASRAAL
jgi:hypothetical protein